MMTTLMRVVSKSAVTQVTKTDGGQTQKSTAVLQCLGGPYEDQFAVPLLGQAALMELHEGTLVSVALQFGTHEYQGRIFQDVTLRDITILGNREQAPY